MNDRDRSLLTDIFNQLHSEINRQGDDLNYESEYLRLIIRELEQVSSRATLNLQLIEAKKANQA